MVEGGRNGSTDNIASKGPDVVVQSSNGSTKDAEMVVAGWGTTNNSGSS